MRIGILLGSIHRGFLVGVGAELSKRHDVFFVALNAAVKKFVDLFHPEFSERTVNVDGLVAVDDSRDVVQECLQRESRYGVRFSFLLAQDRGLGKGYLSNVQWHPDRADSAWEKDRKLAALLGDMQAIEEVCSRHSPDVMLGYFNITKYNVVLRHLGIPYLSLAPVKFHSRYLWSDDEYITSREFVEKVKEYAADPLDEGFTIPEYAQVDASAYLFKKLKVGYLSKIHQALRIAEDELKKLVFRRRPENAYRFMGWVWPVLRYPGMYGYMMKHGVVPDDLRGSRVVFFPLHYEPEVALMSFSPEVNNSYEVISWLSKSVPSDTYVVIKEQPHMFGMRSKWYYDLYRKMGNVAFARPDVTSWEWIRRCDVASTITGTVATESVFFEKPLLSFNTHNIVNLLPSVRVASNYEETRRGLDDLLQLTDRAVLKKSRYALCRALLDVSFDLPEFTSYMKKNAIPEALAQTAAQALHDHYPAIFRGEA